MPRAKLQGTCTTLILPVEQSLFGRTY